jgi:putative peptidoglycan binding protein
MTIRTLSTAAVALALGLAWTAAPATAQTVGEKIKDKAETTKEKIEDKSRELKDKIKSKTDRDGDRTAEKAADKIDRTADKAENKVDRAADKADAKMERGKAKAESKMDKAKATMHRMDAKAEHADVMAMQRALKDKGHDPGPTDGIMGPRTRAALRDYQRKEGLTPSGRWDAETASRLGVATSQVKPDTMTPSASPSMPSSPSTVATPPNVSTQPPATPEDKTAPPAKRTSP